MGMQDNDAHELSAGDDRELSHIIDYIDAGGDRCLAIKRLLRHGLSHHDAIEFVLRYDNTIWDSRDGSHAYEYDYLRRHSTTYH